MWHSAWQKEVGYHGEESEQERLERKEESGGDHRTMFTCPMRTIRPSSSPAQDCTPSASRQGAPRKPCLVMSAVTILDKAFHNLPTFLLSLALDSTNAAPNFFASAVPSTVDTARLKCQLCPSRTKRYINELTSSRRDPSSAQRRRMVPSPTPQSPKSCHGPLGSCRNSGEM